MSKKGKKLQLKRRNHLVAIVMLDEPCEASLLRKAVRKHMDRKRKAKQTHQQENDYE